MEAITETNSERNLLQSKESFERHGVLPATTYVLESLSLVFGFMYDNNMEHIWDYYVVVCRNPIVSTTSRIVSNMDSLVLYTPFPFCLKENCR
jgi:hypothetical protein